MPATVVALEPARCGEEPELPQTRTAQEADNVLTTIAVHSSALLCGHACSLTLIAAHSLRMSGLLQQNPEAPTFLAVKHGTINQNKHSL